MQSMITRDARTGARAVLQAASTSLATIVFLPGVLIRIAFQQIAGSLKGQSVTHHGFIQELGGDVNVNDDTAATMFFTTLIGPIIVGALLLAPAILKQSLLDIRPFEAISSNPRVLTGDGSSFLPLASAFSRYGMINFLRLWAGVSCFFCCIPSASLTKSTGARIKRWRRFSPHRLLASSVVAMVRVLRAIDLLLLVGFAGVYLASGLIVLLAVWRLIAFAGGLM